LLNFESQTGKKLQDEVEQASRGLSAIAKLLLSFAVSCFAVKFTGRGPKWYKYRWWSFGISGPEKSWRSPKFLSWDLSGKPDTVKTSHLLWSNSTQCNRTQYSKHYVPNIITTGHIKRSHTSKMPDGLCNVIYCIHLWISEVDWLRVVAVHQCNQSRDQITNVLERSCLCSIIINLPSVAFNIQPSAKTTKLHYNRSPI